LRYSGEVPRSRWGDAIAFHLAERGWSQRQLADKASLRPNTLTNLIKHGRDSDTATLSRIATALQVDVAELFLTREQAELLRSHRDHRVDKAAVVREVSATVSRLVQKEIDRVARTERGAVRKRGARR
jgi:transcriptional regulator with XRE-family HTH domain